MKQFFKTVLAVICGIIILNLITFVFGLAFLGAAMASGNKAASIPKEGVLYIDMEDFTLGEQTSEFSMPSLTDLTALTSGGGKNITIGIWDAVQALNIASKDPGIKYVYLYAQGASGGTATLQEFRTALDNCRKNGKAVVAKLTAPDNASMYLASAADKVYLSSYEGTTGFLTGLSSQLIFYKDLLDKLGVNVQLIRHGKYKSAGEGYIKNAPSPENLEQNQVMVDGIWNSFAGAIAESRGLTLEKFNELVDNLQLGFPEQMLEAGLVDGLATTEEFKQKLTDLAVAKEYDDIKFIPFADYVKAKVKDNLKSKKKIAIIYADGEIVEGTQKQEIAGTYFSKVIADVRKDSTIKAVVFRVNSPGGSVYASDQIKTEIDLLAKDKPVVASYGNYAASGGYWISNSCEKIFANPATLTGSIGVFSMIPDLSGTIKDLAHVNIVSVKSNKHSDMMSMVSPLDEEETAFMQATIERIYEGFVNNVARGRDLEPAFADSIAQGRVWTGSDALTIGLVDELGTLEDALKYTVNLVEPGTDLNKWRIMTYPKPMSQMEMIMESLGQSKVSKANIFKGTPLEGTAATALRWVENWQKHPDTYLFARIPYDIVIK